MWPTTAQVITIIEIDVAPTEFRSASASLTRPDSLARLAQIVETTQPCTTGRSRSSTMTS